MSDARRANLGAIIVILLSGGLSAVWAFLVPIFQAPDEPAHFDYAVSIYNARRLVTSADGASDWIVSPYTTYLMRAADFDRLAWHSSMRVPKGYGTRAYFESVDAGQPALQAGPLRSGKISYIARAYPFGFYALEALWMHVVAAFTGSLVAVFFGGRLLCVFLMMLGLYFNYRTALNLGLARWVSVALVAAIGFFPLTTFVSSYIQPDNLAYALVSATLFFATELSRRGPRPIVTAALGVSLGLLAITKYQFFLSVAGPVVLLFIVKFTQERTLRARWPGLLAAFAAPSVLLLAVQYWVIERPSVATFSATSSQMSLSFFRAELATGPVSAVTYVAGTSLAGFMDCFVSGGCAATFWQVVGWFDTPIVIINTTAEVWIRASISLATIAIFFVVGYSAARNALRLLRLALHRHPSAALRLAATDPVFNSYLFFLAIITALYVLTHNAFGAEGRQLYPYIFPAFLCLVSYAPRAISRRYRGGSTIMAGVLLAYSTTAAAYALADVHQRYYGPSEAQYVAADPAPAQVKPHDAGRLVALLSGAYRVNGSDLPFAFSAGAPVVAVGVSISPKDRVVSPRVAVVVDSRHTVPVLSGQYVYRVAEALRSIADGYSGFFATISTEYLAEGAHTVNAYAQRIGDRQYGRVGPVRVFFLTRGGEGFSAAYVEALRNAPLVHGDLRIVGTCTGFSSLAHGVRVVDAGAVALLTGTVAKSPFNAYHGVWLLLDKRPHPARYEETTQTFVATVPTADLAVGPHQVVAYAITDRPEHPLRILGSATLSVAPGPGASQYLVNPPASCADPMHQLEGLDA